MTLEKFQTLADAYGAKLDRWPVDDRSAAGQLLTSDPRARALIAEASALDRLLDLPAPGRSGSVAGLADRIVAAATTGPAGQSSGSPVKSSAVVVTLPQPQTRSELPAEARSAPARMPVLRIARIWPAAAALAASLACGILIGAHDLTHAPVRGLVALASASSDTDVDQFVAALHGDGIASGTDEERQ